MEEPVVLRPGDQEDAEAALARQTGTVARFNRFYAKQIGSLIDSLTQGTFSPTEARVLAELATCGSTTATELAGALALDAGYLSRIVRGFEERSLIVKAISEADARRVPISLTEAGREASARLEHRAQEDIRELLVRLPADHRGRLVDAMDGITRILGDARDDKAPSFVLRGPEPGDMGWVVQRHGVLYQQEFGWDEKFEALVAEVVAKFVKHYDPKREQCWIAEREGVPVGCIFLVKHNDENA